MKDRDGSWVLSVERVEVGRIVSGEVRLPTDLAVPVDGHDELLGAVLAGPVRYDDGAA